MPRISSTHQVTLPVDILRRAGLRAGDAVTIEVDETDRIVLSRTPPDVDLALGIFDGLYEPDHLERLRSEERA